MTSLSDYSQEKKQENIEKGIKYKELNLLGDFKRFSVDFGEIIQFEEGENIYDIYIEGLYPFQAPRVYCRSFISDFKGDLLESCIEKSWSQGLTLSTIKSKLSCDSQGKYHLGHTFPLYLFPEEMVFSCSAVDPITYKFHQQIKIVLTNTHLFQVQIFHSNSGHLVAYGNLNSIKSLKLFEDKFTIVWRGVVDHIQVFKAPNAMEICESIMNSIKNSGFTVKKQEILRNSIREEDVSPQFILKIKINEIESEITNTELELEHELTKKNINLVLQLYQKAIEYYSALGSEKFDVYLKKIRGLMCNNDVLVVLAEEDKVEIQYSDNAKEFEELEVWPSNIPS